MAMAMAISKIDIWIYGNIMAIYCHMACYIKLINTYMNF